MAAQGFRSRPASLNGNAHILNELAGYLRAGRLDGELGTQARAPRAPREIGDEVVRITRFAADQCADVVALLSALATKVREVANAHVAFDDAKAVQYRAASDLLLKEGTMVMPDRR